LFLASVEWVGTQLSALSSTSLGEVVPYVFPMDLGLFLDRKKILDFRTPSCRLQSCFFFCSLGFGPVVPGLGLQVLSAPGRLHLSAFLPGRPRIFLARRAFAPFNPHLFVDVPGLLVFSFPTTSGCPSFGPGRYPRTHAFGRRNFYFARGGFSLLPTSPHPPSHH